MGQTKVCTKCKISIETSLFSKNTGTKDKLFSWCKSCQSINDRKRRRKIGDKLRSYNKQWRIDHPEYFKIYDQDRWRKNKEKFKKRAKQWAIINADKKKKIEKAWVLANPDKILAKTARRRAAKIRRTPPWLTDLQQLHISLFYEASTAMTKELGIKFNVDHIVPLQGDNVCGLHVPWNLQILSAKDNFSKGNRL